MNGQQNISKTVQTGLAVLSLAAMVSAAGAQVRGGGRSSITGVSGYNPFTAAAATNYNPFTAAAANGYNSLAIGSYYSPSGFYGYGNPVPANGLTSSNSLYNGYGYNLSSNVNPFGYNGGNNSANSAALTPGYFGGGYNLGGYGGYGYSGYAGDAYGNMAYGGYGYNSVGNGNGYDPGYNGYNGYGYGAPAYPSAPVGNGYGYYGPMDNGNGYDNSSDTTEDGNASVSVSRPVPSQPWNTPQTRAIRAREGSSVKVSLVKSKRSRQSSSPMKGQQAQY